MSKVRVPLHGKPANYAVVETEATAGAVIGTNLFNADGTLFDIDAFTVQVAERQSSGTGVPTEGETVISWTAIQSIPANITQAKNLTGEGFLRRDDAGVWSASAIVNADLSEADTDGLTEGSTNLYFTNARVDARNDAVHAALVNAVDDAAAATAGVPVGQLYRNGSVLMIRVT